MDLATFQRLRSPEGRQALTRAVELYADGGDSVRAGAELRRTTDAELAAAAMSQAALRVAARAKLGDDASVLFFTPDALEQCTRAEVAAHRAARVSFAAPSSVVDLGCGIGGDLIALARRLAPTETPVA